LKGGQLKNDSMILLVDDNPVQQRVLGMLAEKTGVKAHVVGSGLEALEALDRYPGAFALILMDWRMAGMDGLECTKRIRLRERGTGRRIPIIAVTACAFDEDKKNCLEAGMDDYLSKPFSLEQFAEKIGFWLDRTNAASATVDPAPKSIPPVSLDPL
jgi:CheY-like chemotaxis protein